MINLDLDDRLMGWTDCDQAHNQVGRALSMVAVAIGNLIECEVVVDESDPDCVAEALLDKGIDPAVVRQGPKGVLARMHGEPVEAAALPVEVVNGLGAGGRLWWRPVSRAVGGLAAGVDPEVHQWCGGGRWLSAGVFDRHADRP